MLLHHPVEAVKHCGTHTNGNSARVQEPGFGSVEIEKPDLPKNESICDNYVAPTWRSTNLKQGYTEVFQGDVHIVKMGA